ncbi:MAG: membrane protein insertase YidC [Bacteroidales bacterium]|nr:membrane protein insertase YidC [Bacteroidales bacterium]
MKKNTVIGWVLIAAIMIGFMVIQSNQMEKQRASMLAQKHVRDSIEQVQRKADSVAKAERDSLIAAGVIKEDAPVVEETTAQGPAFKDSLLIKASDESAQAQLVTLSNEKLEVTLTTKGGQPYSAHVKDYTNYDKSDLYLFNCAATPNASTYNVAIYVNELVNTKDFNFEVASATDSSVVMRLPFAGGGYIEQAYTLKKDSYLVDNTLSFVNLDIPKNVYSFDVDWNVIVPRMEKGYRNEMQYSLAAYRLDGDDDPEEFAKGRNGNVSVNSKISWLAYHQQFFSAIFRAKDNFDALQSAVAYVPENEPGHNLMACGARFKKELDLTSQERVFEHEFYFGPNNYNGLKSLDQKYEKTIPLGGSIIGLFTRYVIIPVFDFLNGFNLNFGIIILLMTIFIKIVVFPLSFKSFSSSAKMQILKPEVEKINAKYPKPEDAMKKQQATMALYKRAGASMMGGCLPMLLQFPILWAMFRFFPASIELRQQPFLWAEDLSAYDSILNFGTSIPLIGDHLSLFALLMAVSMFFYTKLTQTQMSSNDPNGKMMRFMTMYFMPIMMFVICNNLSSGLSYYYLLSNIITMITTWVIRKWVVKPEDVYARLKATEGKPMPKSKWQQRLEEAQKMQQQQMRNARR